MIPSDNQPTLIFLHGIGLGSWFWEPWLPFFQQAGFSIIAPTLPGHGDGQNAGILELVHAVEKLIQEIKGPVILIGHSMSGLIAQLVAEKQELAGMVLLCPILPGQIRVLPDKRMVKSGIKLMPAFFLGKPLKVSRNSYQELGLNQLPESLVDTVYPKIVPWPNRLARQLLIPPRVAIERVCCPVLVVAGKEDRLVPWEKARVLGDLYEGVVWRYDKLAHMPPWEPLSERVASDILSWCQTPSRPQVLESEGFGPKEGVGHGLRRQRRGEEMKRRSAYGQKDSTRKKS